MQSPLEDKNKVSSDVSVFFPTNQEQANINGSHVSDICFAIITTEVTPLHVFRYVIQSWRSLFELLIGSSTRIQIIFR